MMFDAETEPSIFGRIPDPTENLFQLKNIGEKNL